MKRVVIQDLWKRFGTVDVLAGLNLVVEPGETLVILGRSGVGKSVLLKHILGLIRPDRGRVEVGGEAISELRGGALYRAIRRMGMLFQSAALFDSMTVGQNTAFYLSHHGDPGTGEPLEREEIERRASEALAMVGLEGTEEKMPSQLSGGMRKRAGLARLIVYRPEVILYDEPTTGLDPVTSAQISDLMVKTGSELGSTSIVVTHDMRLAVRVADRIAMQEEGKIACIFEPNQIEEVDHPLVRAFVEESTIGTIGRGV